jgi:hypothetical protein
LLVKEQQCGEGLVLGGRADLRLGKARQIGADLGLGHVVGLTFAMKKDEPADPSEVGLFGPGTVVVA